MPVLAWPESATVTNLHEHESAHSAGYMLNSGLVQGEVFTNNSAVGDTSGLQMTNAYGNVDSCVFAGNDGQKGSAIFQNACVSNISNSLFEENLASTSGGAIFRAGACRGNIIGCTFLQNTAEQLAGAVYDDQTVGSISNSTFSQNGAQQSNTASSILRSQCSGSISSCKGLGKGDVQEQGVSRSP